MIPRTVGDCHPEGGIMRHSQPSLTIGAPVPSILAVLILACLTSVACGGGGSTSTNSTSSATAQSSNSGLSNGVLGDPCSLVSASDVSAAFDGTQFADGTKTTDGHVCNFRVLASPQAGQVELVQVNVGLATAFDTAVSLGAEEFDGPGDKTSWWVTDSSDQLNAAVGQGMIGVDISPSGVSGARDKAMALAEKAIGGSGSISETQKATSTPTQRTSASPTIRAATATAEPQTPNLNPCELVTKDDAAQTLGDEVADGQLTPSTEPAQFAQCRYVGKVTPQEAHTIDVQVLSDGATADYYSSLFQTAVNNGIQSVPGYGDIAVWQPNSTSSPSGLLEIVDGSTVLTINIVGPSGSDALELAKGLASKALARVPSLGN